MVNQMNHVAVDNMIFYDEQGKNKLIFHRHTWLSLLKGILIHYFKYTEHDAETLINHSTLCHLKHLNYYTVMMLCHEEVYHWAMILCYGEHYWQKGYSVDLPDDYDVWLKQYMQQHQLNQYIIE